MNIEERVYNTLAEEKNTIKIGGETVRLSPLSVKDSYEVASIVSKLRDVVDSEYITDKDILSLLDAKEVCNIISIAAKSTIKNSLLNRVDTYFKRKRLYNIVYKKATNVELGFAITKIIPQMQLFFYRRAISSLKGVNTLKPTKEIETTAPTHL